MAAVIMAAVIRSGIREGPLVSKGAERLKMGSFPTSGFRERYGGRPLLAQCQNRLAVVPVTGVPKAIEE